MRVLTFDLDYSGRPTIDLFVSPVPEQNTVAGPGQPPARWPVRALVDSGASRTLIKKTVIEALGLVSAGETELFTASSGPIPITASTYLIRLFLQRVAGDLLASELETVEAEDLSGLKVDMLLGRDVLDRCLVIYNGPEKKLTLAFEPPSSEE